MRLNLKIPIRNFMRAYYTDERLAELLAHALDGKLAYNSCCCFVGVVTAKHELKSRVPTFTKFVDGEHYYLAKAMPGAEAAELAFYRLGLIYSQYGESSDEARRRILIPIIRAEMKRREKVRIGKAEEIETALVAV